jgi:glutaredoxin
MENTQGATTFLSRFIKIYVSLCTAVVVLGACFFGTYVVMNASRIFPARESIVIYGRDSCGFTSAMRESLTEQRIPFVYGDIDEAFISEEMWHHLRRNTEDGALHTAHLPIVLINDQVLERPEAEVVLKQRKLALEHQP